MYSARRKRGQAQKGDQLPHQRVKSGGARKWVSDNQIGDEIRGMEGQKVEMGRMMMKKMESWPMGTVRA